MSTPTDVRGAVGVNRRPQEINVQAKLCNGTRYRTVGELVTYRAALWLVKGLYFGSTRSGEPDLFYILSEASPSLEQVDGS